MDLETSKVFSAALDGCRKLQQEFPRDQRLASIVAQLERWKASLGQHTQQTPAHARVRIDPRYLRPLSEDLARVVHHASVEASRLGLC